MLCIVYKLCFFILIASFSYLSKPTNSEHIFHRLDYNLLLLVQMEHLKACAEIATQRTINWQKFCMKDDCRLFQISIATGNKLLRTVMLILLYFFPPPVICFSSLASRVVLPAPGQFPSG